MSWQSLAAVVSLWSLMCLGVKGGDETSAASASIEGAAIPAASAATDTSVTEPGASKAVDELRDRVRSAMRQPLRILATAPYAEARALVALCAELRSDESLPTGERERFQNLVRTRLAQARGAIVRSVRRQKAESERTARRHESVEGAAATSRASDAAGSSRAGERTASAGTDNERTSAASQAEGQPAGGGPQNDAQDLIELIETTIAPESWEARGGKGVIKYWAPGMALVIRQTREVHEQIGGVVGAQRP